MGCGDKERKKPKPQGEPCGNEGADGYGTKHFEGLPSTQGLVLSEPMAKCRNPHQRYEYSKSTESVNSQKIGLK